jgi:uncharacterized protein YndB with AHSA1/START domain
VKEDVVEPTWATLDTADNRPVLRFERRLAHPPEKVWRAITDPAEMQHWFPATVQTESKIGARMRFSFAGNHPDLESRFDEGEVLEFDPPRVYAFRWADSVLRFELCAEEPGCRLIFTHALGGTGTWGDRASAARQAAGWDACLGKLVARLDERTHELVGAWWFESAERYVELFGLAEGEITDVEGGYLVRFERDLVQPVDTVWAALLEGCEAAPVVGAAPPPRVTNVDVSAGSVTEVDPPHSLEYAALHEGAPVGRVRFECRVQEPVGCRLVVTQTLPSRLAGLRATVLAAWQTHLELLFAALHGHVRPWPTERAEGLKKTYATRLS